MKQKVFLDSFKGRIRFNEPLRERTSLRIGGPAKLWVEPMDPEDLLKVFSFARDEDRDIFIIGEGTNLLVSDKGFEGIVVNLCAPYFKKISKQSGEVALIYAGAGVKLDALRSQVQKWCFGGFEFLAGIPGSVGGALIMNAGVRDFNERRIEIGDLVWEVSVMDKKGNIRALKRRDLDFGYRTSNLKEFVVLGVNFKLERCKPEEILRKTNLFFERRRASQDLSFSSAGCIFKNPADIKSAGALIEQCGLKGTRVGDAQISHLHANFIVNLGEASFGDVLSLIEIAKKKVKKEFDVELELEVKILE